MKFIYKTFKDLTNEEVFKIAKARIEIFVVEEHILVQELDDIDLSDDCYHMFLLDNNNEIVGYLRAYYIDKEKKTVQIGRVLSIIHNLGIGKELMTKALEFIKNTMKAHVVLLHSQSYCKDFYKLFGFIEIDNEFIEANIKHIKMIKNI